MHIVDQLNKAEPPRGSICVTNEGHWVKVDKKIILAGHCNDKTCTAVLQIWVGVPQPVQCICTYTADIYSEQTLTCWCDNTWWRGGARLGEDSTCCKIIKGPWKKKKSNNSLSDMDTHTCEQREKDANCARACINVFTESDPNPFERARIGKSGMNTLNTLQLNAFEFEPRPPMPRRLNWTFTALNLIISHCILRLTRAV